MTPENMAHNVITVHACIMHVLVWPSCGGTVAPWASWKRIEESTNGQYSKENIRYQDNELPRDKYTPSGRVQSPNEEAQKIVRRQVASAKWHRNWRQNRHGWHHAKG